jgi:hypothetical protein
MRNEVVFQFALVRSKTTAILHGGRRLTLDNNIVLGTVNFLLKWMKQQSNGTIQIIDRKN